MSVYTENTKLQLGSGLMIGSLGPRLKGLMIGSLGPRLKGLMIGSLGLRLKGLGLRL